MRRLSELEKARREALDGSRSLDKVERAYAAYVDAGRMKAREDLAEMEQRSAFETYLLKKAQDRSRETSVNGEKRSTPESRKHRAEILRLDREKEKRMQSDPDFFFAVCEKEIQRDLADEQEGRLVNVPYLLRAKKKAMDSLRAGIPVYFVGHLGSGKTQLALECATDFMREDLLQKKMDEAMGEEDITYARFEKVYPKIREEVESTPLHPYFIAGSHDLTADDMFFEKTLKLSHQQAAESNEEQLETLINGFYSFVKQNESILSGMNKDQQLEFMLAGWKTFSNLYIAENSGYGTTVEKIEKEVLLALREGKPVIIDEINTIAMANLIALNDILQHHAGQTAYVTGVGSITIERGFCLIGTGNLSTGTVSYEGTNALNPAFQSRFTTIVYNYVPQETEGDLDQSEHPEKNELFRLMLLHLLSRDGTLSLPSPRQTLSDLWHLAQMARLSQNIFEGHGGDDGSGDAPVLNEAVLSIRGIIHVLDRWNFGEDEDLDGALWDGFLSSVTNADDRNLLLALSVRCGFFTEQNGWKVPSRGRGEAGLSYEDIREEELPQKLLPLETLSLEDVVYLIFGNGPKRTEITEDLGDTVLFDGDPGENVDLALSLDHSVRELSHSADLLSDLAGDAEAPHEDS